MKRVAITKLTREEKKQIRQETKLAKQNYNKDLKELQKRYKPAKIDRAHNKDAKKNWMPMLKFNCDWDWSFIINVILYKIELTKLYIKHFGNTIEEDRMKKVAEMEEAIKLYDTYCQTDFYKEAGECWKDHVCHYIFISEDRKNIREPKYKIPTASDSLMFYEIDAELCKDQRIKAEAYALTAGVPKEALYDKNLIRSFGSEWDNEENEKHYLDLVKQGEKAEQKALDKFFLHISKHIQGWWD